MSEDLGLGFDIGKPPDDLIFILGMIAGIWMRYKQHPTPAVFEELGDVLDQYVNFLRRGEPPRTYMLLPDPAIVCLLCGMISHHPEDVAKKYCGNCHRFHE